MENVVVILFGVLIGVLLDRLAYFLWTSCKSKVKEEEESLCLDFFYTRKKENDTLQEVRFYYKADYSFYGGNPTSYFTYRSGFKNKEALRHHIDQACENRGWKFEFTDYEVDYATGLPIEKVEKEIK